MPCPGGLSLRAYLPPLTSSRRSLQPPTLDVAFASARALVLIAAPDAKEVVARAQTAGIEHIVVVSSGAVTAGFDTTYNLPVELAVQASGLDWSIVRPGEFATNALLM